jgi:hypothetical protein
LSTMRVEPHHKKRVYSQWEAKICLQGLSASIRGESGMEADLGGNESLNRQVAPGTGVAGRHCSGDRSISTMAARLRQCQVPSPTASHRYTCSKKGKLILQCDELWSFVGKKAHQVWLWLALDADTRMIVGCAIGPRDKATAEDLWFSLPPEYRQRAVCFYRFLSGLCQRPAVQAP